MRARRVNLGWVLGVCGLMLWFGSLPALGMQAGEFGEGDYGDAPEGALAYPFNGVIGRYPTCISVGPPGSFIRHLASGPYFGPMVDGEMDGNAGLCPMFNPNRYNQDECFQDGDAGLLVPPGYTIRGPMGLEQIVPCSPNLEGFLGQTCQMATWGGNIDIHVVNNSNRLCFVNVLIDWDQDGAWGGNSPCPMNPAPEHVLIDFPVPPGFVGPLSALMPPSFLIGPNSGYVWARFTIAERAVGTETEWDGSGVFEYGETEDYLLRIEQEQEPEPEFDYGDAPEEALAYSTGVLGRFPTCINVGPPGSFIQHAFGHARFGQGWDPEFDGNGGLCPMFAPYDSDECFQDGDAGLLFPEPFTIQGGVEVPCPSSAGTSLGLVCQPAVWGNNIDILVTNNMPGQRPAYVNVLIDWNQDGAWGGVSTCPGGTMAPEHVLVDFVVPPGFSGPLSTLGPPSFLIGPNPGFVWARFSITERPVGATAAWDGSGIFEDGETEDYLLRIEREQEPEPEFDYGDAPEEALAYSTGVLGRFPTCINVGPPGSFIQHARGHARFGQGWDPEFDGNGGLCPMFAPYDSDECFQDGDAGLLFPEPFTIQGGLEVPCPSSAGTSLGLVCQPAVWGNNIDILVTNNMLVKGYVNVLIDWDQNGVWGGISTCPGGTITPEHVLVDFIVPPGFSGPLSALLPPSFLIGPNPGFVWARFSITERPVGMVAQWDGSGVFEDGETEDYLLRIEQEQEPLFDYGDAPEEALAYSTGVIGMFPTCINVGPPGSFIQHAFGNARFGPPDPLSWDPEPDGNGGLCPMFAPYDSDECFQDGDAGLLFPEPFTIQGGVEVPCPSSAGTALGQVCQPAVWGNNIDILVTNNMLVEGYVNVLIDWDQNGVWSGLSSCPDGTVTPEHVLVDFPVPVGFSGPLSALMPPNFLIGPNPGYVWARFSITERPVSATDPWDGSGIFEDGETEDYLLLIEGDTTPPEIVGDWYSWKYHGLALGKLARVFPQTPQTLAPIETRGGSVTELTFAFSEPINPATFTPAAVTICGYHTIPPPPTSATLDASGTQATLIWPANAIPNGFQQLSVHDHYVICIHTSVTDLAGNPLAGDRDVDFAASFGNVRFENIGHWRLVNSLDRTLLAQNYTNNPTPAQAITFDIRIDGGQAGRINSLDRTQLAQSYTPSSAQWLIQAPPPCSCP